VDSEVSLRDLNLEDADRFATLANNQRLSEILTEEGKLTMNDSMNRALVTKYEATRYYEWDGLKLKLKHERVDSNEFYSADIDF
jgi:hypothetical protein